MTSKETLGPRSRSCRLQGYHVGDCCLKKLHCLLPLTRPHALEGGDIGEIVSQQMIGTLSGVNGMRRSNGQS